LFHASEDSIDDLMRAIFKQLLNGRGNHSVVSNKGKSTEIFGAILELKKPRARLSRSFSRAKAFSPLGELFWYLSGDESIKFIEHYIPIYGNFSNDGLISNGAYGPRIFGIGAQDKLDGKSNWDRVIETLREREGSRNALIQIYENSDAKTGNKDKPCTCTLQFAIRRSQLLMHTHMRSNDAFLGLPHDIFSFTMLQEIAARELGLGLGAYTHSVTSLHLYHDGPASEGILESRSTSGAKAYFDEGLLDYAPMPEMPIGDPWPSIRKVMAAEEAIRLGNPDFPTPEGLASYWIDLIDLFRIHAIFEGLKSKNGKDASARSKLRAIAIMMKRMSPVYRIYILGRLEKKLNPVRDLFELANRGA
jgi:thymidylate synthase